MFCGQVHVPWPQNEICAMFFAHGPCLIAMAHVLWPPNIIHGQLSMTIYGHSTYFLWPQSTFLWLSRCWLVISCCIAMELGLWPWHMLYCHSTCFCQGTNFIGKHQRGCFLAAAHGLWPTIMFFGRRACCMTIGHAFGAWNIFYGYGGCAIAI